MRFGSEGQKGYLGAEPFCSGVEKGASVWESFL